MGNLPCWQRALGQLRLDSGENFDPGRRGFLMALLGVRDGMVISLKFAASSFESNRHSQLRRFSTRRSGVF